MKDNFGDRMKKYERLETERKFIPLLPIYARIDGRGFSKFTKGLKRPYDSRLTLIMSEVTKMLVEKTNALLGYTQSDEISLLWHSEDPKSEMFFDGKVQKMTSVIASLTTSLFMQECIVLLGQEYFDKTPHFDCRVFQLPNKIEATNVFLWREQDATKNAISMAARCYYSHKSLQGVSSSEMQELLFQKGINFNDYDPCFKRGSFYRKEEYEIDSSELDDVPEEYRPEGKVTRNKVMRLHMPKFSTVLNREGVIFNGETPITTPNIT